MYINGELHDALCTAGLYAIGVMLIVFAAALLMPYIVRFARRTLRRVRMWLDLQRELAEIRRDLRRYKASLRVFKEPVRWTEDKRR